MKKFIAIILCLLLCTVTFISCNNSGDENVTDSVVSDSESVSESETETETETDTETETVDVSGFNGMGDQKDDILDANPSPAQ